MTGITENEEQIRQLKQAMTLALRRKDVEGVMACFAPQTVMYLLDPPLRLRTGVNAPGESGIRAWFDSFDGPLGYEYIELEITCAEAVAFCHGLDRISGKRNDGSQTDVWVRETLGLRKTTGRWLITHQHQSVPLYMDGSERAALDLEP